MIEPKALIAQQLADFLLARTVMRETLVKRFDVKRIREGKGLMSATQHGFLKAFDINFEKIDVIDLKWSQQIVEGVEWDGQHTLVCHRVHHIRAPVREMNAARMIAHGGLHDFQIGSVI